jgi:2-C-methyl-D-erythritol 2,4-cyclodiphosphate synthase
MRVGIGYDVHRLVAGRKLVLGGVLIEHLLGLDGHSDADVLLHAIADALLGAAALGDIGQHFPPGDPKYRNICSSLLLEEVRGLLDSSCYQIRNVDATVVAEEPRLASYIPNMKQQIAIVLGISPGQVSIKATTNEGLGFPGRQEGIAAWAVALIENTRGKEN